MVFKKGHMAWNKGNPPSEEHRRKLSEALNGGIFWNKGKTGVYSEETRRKISETMKGGRNQESNNLG